MGKLVLICIPIVIVIVIYGSIFLIRHLLNKNASRDYGRQLTAAEHSGLRYLATKLDRDKDAMVYPIRYSLLIMGGLVPVFLVGGLLTGLVWFLYKSFREKILMAVPADAYRVFTDIEFPFSAVLAGFSGALLGGWITILFARRSPKLTKYLTYQIGWGTLSGGVRDLETLNSDLIHLFYLDKLDLSNPSLSADDLVPKIFEGMNRKWINASCIFMVMTFIFLCLDINVYSWVDDEEFVHNRYFSLVEERFTAEDVLTVEKTCWVTIPNGVRKAHLEYVVIGPSGNSLDLGHEPWRELMPLIERLEKRRKSEFIAPKIKVAVALKGLPETVSSCVQYLEHKTEYTPELKAKLWSIFGLDKT